MSYQGKVNEKIKVNGMMQADNPIHKTKKTQLKDKNVHDTVHLQFKALVSNRC